MDAALVQLEVRAAGLFPGSEYLQREWVMAVLWLRSRGLWIYDGARAKWGHAEREDRVAA